MLVFNVSHQSDVIFYWNDYNRKKDSHVFRKGREKFKKIVFHVITPQDWGLGWGKQGTKQWERAPNRWKMKINKLQNTKINVETIV